MRFTTHINNQKCLEWGLNANQGALFDLLNQSAAWAEPVIVNGETFYWVSRAKVINELPLFYAKSDTVYRHFVDLNDKGLIIYLKHDGRDLIKLTGKGKEWNFFNTQINSEINPNNSETNPTLGNESENTRIEIRKSSDLNPTDKYINNKYLQLSDLVSPKTATPTKLQKFSDDDLKTAHWIFDLILKINPNNKPPNFERWANEIRLLRERDGRTHREICELFRFANADNFWCANIRSPAKLREHWDRLMIEKAKPTRKPTFSELNAAEWNTPEAWSETF